MRTLDRVLQHWRIRKAVPWVRKGDRLLDVGCYDDSLIARVGDRISSAVGVDPVIEGTERDGVLLLRGHFPEDTSFSDGEFDCVAMLAVFEHVDDPAAIARECARVLSSNGRVVMTVPHPFVDRILHALIKLKLLDGMEAHAHHGFDVSQTESFFFAAGFELRKRRRFQLGLNNLFVFDKTA